MDTIQKQINEMVDSSYETEYTFQEALNYYLGYSDLYTLSIHDALAEILGSENPELKTVQNLLNEYIDTSYKTEYTIQEALAVIESFLPNRDENIQAVVMTTPQYNSDSEYWEFKDKRGSRDGEVLEGKAYLFDGTDDYVDWGFAPTNGDTYFDVSMDVIRTDGKSIGFINEQDTSHRKLGIVWYSDNMIYLIVDNSGGSTLYAVTGALTGYGNDKVTIRGVYDGSLASGSRVKIYVNGVEQTITSDNTPSSYVGTSPYNFRTGKYGSDYYDNYVGNIIIKDSSGDIIHSWHCDEGDGTTAYDSVGSNNGTINYATLSTFHGTNNWFTSYQNEKGYTLSGTTYKPIKLDSDGESTHLDIDGNTPTYDGLVRRNIKVVNNNCVKFDGTDDYINLNDFINLGTSFTVELDFMYTDTVEQAILGSDSTDFSGSRITIKSDNLFEIRVSGSNTNIAFSSFTLRANTKYNLKLE